MDYHELLSLLQTNHLSLGSLECMLDSYRDDRYDLYFDVVVENQRGVKFFAIPLFSSRSLMPCFDPPQYQNWDGLPLMLSYNSMDNYALPDFCWRWLWDAWHVLMLNDVDDQGWGYLFMFQGLPLWHGKYYFGDFVRRRTWIRMRHRDREEVDEWLWKSREVLPEYQEQRGHMDPREVQSLRDQKGIPQPIEMQGEVIEMENPLRLSASREMGVIPPRIELRRDIETQLQELPGADRDAETEKELDESEQELDSESQQDPGTETPELQSKFQQDLGKSPELQSKFQPRESESHSEPDEPSLTDVAQNTSQKDLTRFCTAHTEFSMDSYSG